MNKSVYHILLWLCSFVGIAEELCNIFSLGFWRPNWNMKAIAWVVLRSLEKKS